MNVVGHVRVDMRPVKQIMARLGIDAKGDVQRSHTANVAVSSGTCPTAREPRSA